MCKYIPITEDRLPEAGDIIVTDRNGNYPSDPCFEEDFEINFMYQIISISDKVDSRTGFNLYKTRDLRNGFPENIFNNHKIIGSIFNEWFILNDKEKRNKKLNILLND